MLAGLLHGLSSGLPAADALAAAVVLGAAAVTLPGSRVPTPEDLHGIPVEVTRTPDLNRSLAQLTPERKHHALITEEQVVLDLTGADRHEATRALAERLVASGRCTDLDTFLADVSEREEQDGDRPARRHRHPARPQRRHHRALARLRPLGDGIDWGAKDGPATLVFLIAAPEGGGDAHMQMLPKLARALMKKDFKAALAAATTEAEVVRIVEAEVALDPLPAPHRPPAAAPAATTATTDARCPRAAGAAGAAAAPPPCRVRARHGGRAHRRPLRLVGVTSCPTGIAHTYMAAEGLENAAKAAGTR